MNTPQSGIFALGTGSHSYMEFDLNPGAGARELLRLVADLRGPRATTGGINLVAGFSPDLWRRVATAGTPPDLHGFDAPIAGVDGYTMPATQHDLWLWASGHSYDKAFDTAADAISALMPVAHLVEETRGWTYKDNRDLTGFIDGTENPSLSEAPDVAIVPDGQPGAGGSIVLVQKWIQHPERWDALSIEEQEKVIGRTKPDSIELPEDVMPPNSHVSRTVIEEDGRELRVFRRNTPFGTVMEHGTMFIGFCAEQRPLHLMLEKMAGCLDGVRDALTYYTTAVTGAYYFVPSVEALRTCGTPEE